MHQKVQLEGPLSIVGEPGDYYLTHLCLSNGRGRTIAGKVYKSTHGTKSHDKIVIVGIDVAASMTESVMNLFNPWKSISGDLCSGVFACSTEISYSCVMYFG